MKNKKIRIVGIIILIAISIFSGLTFPFPKEWNLPLYISVSKMSVTFLCLSSGITLLKVPKFIEQIRG